MEVTLKSLSLPTEELKKQGIETSEDFIVYCARVSNPQNQFNTDTNEKLISYCIKHQHWSIFEQAFCTFEIVTSRAIAAQILRHRSFTFQEFSQRYATATQLEQYELRKQGKTNRQVGEDIYDISFATGDVELGIELGQHRHNTLKLYQKMIDKGIARESARMVLPLHTQTTLYMSGSVRSFIHYIDLRSKQDTQKEHRDIALAMKEVFVQTFPTIAKSLEWK
jgi:thymidylate synthase (FAD)